jgi:7-carboxy-7-deazaguanine synthase
VSYSVKELFYTLQGEGIHAGRPAVFLRFAGCNLWSGRESGRDQGSGGCSKWCDTDFVGTDGQGGGKFSTADELASAVKKTWGGEGGQPFVVCTGGEPLLQLDPALIDALHHHGFFIAIETNGTQPCPKGIDWVCVSPKAGAPLVLTMGDELKFVFPQQDLTPELFEDLEFRHFLLQPMDNLKTEQNTELALRYCLAHPRWRLSSQTHTIIGIP